MRNYYKRRLREIVRHNLHRIKPGYDLIILTRVPVTELEYHELEKNVKYLLRKSGVWIGEKDNKDKNGNTKKDAAVTD